MPSNWGNPNGYTAGNQEGGANDTLTVHAATTLNGTTTVNGATTINNTLEVVSAGGLGSINVGNDGGAGSSLNLTGDDHGGRVEAGYDFGQHADSIVLKLNTNNDNGDVVILHRNGLGADGSVIIASPQLQVGAPVDGMQAAQPGKIDGNGTTGAQPHPLDLLIGTRDITNNVTIGQAGHDVSVEGHILVGAGAGNPARIDTEMDGALFRNLEIGGQNSSATVKLGRSTQVLEIDSSTITAKGSITVGPDANDGLIDAVSTHTLKLGTQIATNGVDIGRSTKTTDIKGKLTVDESSTLTGAVTASSTLGVTGVLTASGHITVGPTNNVGKVDANNSHKLQLGTQAGTTDVDISKSGQTTTVKGQLTVADELHAADAFYAETSANITGDLICDNNLDMEGNLAVGPSGAEGKIDSGGSTPSPQDLKIGTENVTANVQLSQAGQTIDMFGQVRMNNNAVIMNQVASIGAANGAGLVYNAVGHGHDISVDFVINNVVVGYFDSTGIH